jgi:hypothetical protein
MSNAMTAIGVSCGSHQVFGLQLSILATKPCYGGADANIYEKLTRMLG